MKAKTALAVLVVTGIFSLNLNTCSNEQDTAIQPEMGIIIETEKIAVEITEVSKTQKVVSELMGLLVVTGTEEVCVEKTEILKSETETVKILLNKQQKRGKIMSDAKTITTLMFRVLEFGATIFSICETRRGNRENTLFKLVVLVKIKRNRIKKDRYKIFIYI